MHGAISYRENVNKKGKSCFTSLLKKNKTKTKGPMQSRSSEADRATATKNLEKSPPTTLSANISQADQAYFCSTDFKHLIIFLT